MTWMCSPPPHTQGFYYPPPSDSPGGFVLVNDRGESVCVVAPEPGATDVPTPRPRVPGSLAAVLGRFGGTAHGGDTSKAMVLPANFYSDTAILQREINR